MIAVLLFALAIPFYDRMMSSGISFVDLTVLWMNFFGASAATVVLARAVTLADPRFRVVFASSASLALLYAVAYLVLIGGFVSLTVWGSFLRGVAVVVWPIVWAGPAFVAIRKNRDDARKLVAEFEKVREAS